VAFRCTSVAFRPSIGGLSGLSVTTDVLIPEPCNVRAETLRRAAAKATRPGIIYAPALISPVPTLLSGRGLGYKVLWRTRTNQILSRIPRVAATPPFRFSVPYLLTISQLVCPIIASRPFCRRAGDKVTAFPAKGCDIMHDNRVD